jgi:ribosomal protein S18 acetylase RimI-like enzyme
MQHAIRCRELRIDEVRAAPPIPSGYTATSSYRLQRTARDEGPTWSLLEVPRAGPFRKEYDDGTFDTWMESYAEACQIDAFRFVGAFAGHELVGLATWLHYAWNRSLWLADIRVREAVRRSGAGSALVDWLKGETGRSRARGIRVETQTTNVPAIRFYRKHGFEISGFDDHLYENADYERQEIALFLFWERH